MKINSSLLSVIITLLLSIDFVFGQTSALDNTFGVNGVVTTSLTNKSTAGWAIKTQTDGKIIIVGSSWSMNNGDFLAIRYNADGSLDNSFGNNGITTITVSSANDDAWSIEIQSDGKILLGGTSDIGGSNDFAIVRLNSNGTLDNTFDSDGIVTVDIGSASDDRCYSLAIQTDGKIIAAGYRGIGLTSDISILRLNSNGSLDSGFDTDGKVLTSVGSMSLSYAKSVKIQPDGKILLSGSADSDFCLIRYNNDGSLDTSLDSDGIVLTSFGGSDEEASAIAIQSDGKIIATGYCRYTFSNDDFAVARYNINGSLDNTFDSDGKVTTDLGSDDDFAWAISIQSDGKYVVAGTFSNNPSCNFAVARYNTDGTLDSNLDGDGIYISNFTNLEALCASTIQSDGKILVTGSAINSSTFTATTIRLKLIFSGINSAELEGKELLCYPNPVTNTLNIDSEIFDLVNLKVYNCLGQELLNTSFQNKIDFSNYPSGIYSVVVSSPTITMTKRIIVK